MEIEGVKGLGGRVKYDDAAERFMPNFDDNVSCDDTIKMKEAELEDVKSIECPADYSLMATLVESLVKCGYAVTVWPVYLEITAKVKNLVRFEILIDKVSVEDSDGDND